MIMMSNGALCKVTRLVNLDLPICQVHLSLFYNLPYGVWYMCH